MFKFKVAYTTNPDKIQPSLDSGIIDEGDLIIVNKNGKGSMRFILKDKSVLDLTSTTTVDQAQLTETVEEAIEEKLKWDESL